MTLIYHLCGYDKTTERLVEEHSVPARLLPIVRTLIEPAPDDRDLVLPYELSAASALTLAAAIGVTIDSAQHQFFFEASDAPEVKLPRRTISAAAR